MKNCITSELIETLGEDVHRCHGELISAIDKGTVDSDGNMSADYEYHARQLVRAIFAFIEGITFSVKVKAASVNRSGISLSFIRKIKGLVSCVPPG